MAQAVKYPGADTTTQWRGEGGTTMPTVNKLLLHTTESSGWPSYPTFAPTLTFNPWQPRGQRWRQHFPINGSASTLANAGTYRTNRANVCQIEIVAWVDPAHSSAGAFYTKISDDAYLELAEFYAWLNQEWGTPIKAYPNWEEYPASYGVDNGVRMSVSQFEAFEGLCGHQHAPLQTHGDPSLIKIGLIVEKAKAIAEGSPMTLRVLTQNFRKSNIVETVASRHWDRRLPYMVEHLKKINPAVVGAQEATVTQCADIMSAFPNWTYVGGVKFGNVPIFWNTQILQAEEGTLLEKKYPSGERERYATLVRLQHRELDWGGWFGSVHLAANGLDEPNSAELRATQMRWIVADFTAWINAHPHPEDGKPNLIVCGDLNDNLGDEAGVRKIAYDRGGWKPLRKRLPDKVSGRTLRSFNGWKATSSLLHDSKPIDEIFTSGVSLEAAALRRTCIDVLGSWASDHNGYAADIVIN